MDTIDQLNAMPVTSEDRYRAYTEEQLLADPSLDALYEYLGRREDLFFRLSRSSENDFPTTQKWHNQSSTLNAWRTALRKIMVLASVHEGEP